MVNSFLRRSKFMSRNPLKSLCGGSCGGVLRRFAAVAHKSLKNLMRRFCGGVRRGSPIPPKRRASLKRERPRNEGDWFMAFPPSCGGRGRAARNRRQPARRILPAFTAEILSAVTQEKLGQSGGLTVLFPYPCP